MAEAGRPAGCRRHVGAARGRRVGLAGPGSGALPGCGQVDEVAARSGRADGQPCRASGAGTEPGRAGGHRQVGVIEHPSSLGLPPSRREPEHTHGAHPVACDQLGVVGQLGSQASQGLGAAVVLHEELHRAVPVAQDAETVGTNDLAPLRGAAPLGPPLGQFRVGLGPRPARQRAEQPVGPEQVAEALALGQGECPGVVEPGAGHLDAAVGGDQLDAEGAEDVVVGVGADRAEVAKAVENPEPVESGETVPRRGQVVEAQVA